MSPPAPPMRSPAAEVVVMFAGALCGTTGTALTRLAPHASPLSAGAMRLLIGGLTLVVAAAALGSRPTELRGHGPWLAVGAVAVTAYQCCFFTGTTRTGVALATVVALGSAPVFSGVIEAAVERRPPPGRWLVGTLLAIVGISMIATTQPGGRTNPIGILAAMGAGLSWAIYAMIGQRRMRAGLSSTTCMAAMFAGGALLSIPLILVGGTEWLVTGNGVALSLYLGIATVGVVYTCIGWGLRRLPAPTVLTLTLSEPVVAAVLAAVILHQQLRTGGWVGVGVVMTALLITSATRTRGPALPATNTANSR